MIDKNEVDPRDKFRNIIIGEGNIVGDVNDEKIGEGHITGDVEVIERVHPEYGVIAMSVVGPGIINPENEEIPEGIVPMVFEFTEEEALSVVRTDVIINPEKSVGMPFVSQKVREASAFKAVEDLENVATRLIDRLRSL